MTKSHSAVSSVDLGSNFSFAILVLIMLLLVSQIEVGSTSTTAGSCTEPRLAGSIPQEPSHVSQRFNLTPNMTIMLFFFGVIDWEVAPFLAKLHVVPWRQL